MSEVEFFDCEWCTKGQYSEFKSDSISCNVCGKEPMNEKEKAENRTGSFQDYWDFIFDHKEKNTKLRNMQTWNYQQKKIEILLEAVRELKKSNDYYKWAAIYELEENDMIQISENPNVWANGKLAREINQKESVQAAYKLIGEGG